MRLPDDLPQDCLVMVVFRQKQQREADVWKALLEPMTNLEIFEVTYIRRVLRPLAGYAAWGMRHGITSERDRAHTIVAFGLQNSMAETLHGDPDRPIVVRVTGGLVVASVQGRPALDAAEMLLAAAA